MQINKNTVEQFREDFQKTVKILEEKYDVEIKLGRIGIEQDSFKSTLEVRKSNLTQTEWEDFCGNFGLKKEDLGKRFFYKSRWYTIVGLKLGVNYPIKTMRDDNKEFSFRPDAVKEALLGND